MKQLAGVCALCTALYTAGCTTQEDALDLGTSSKAVEVDPLESSCGFEVTTGTYTTWPGGYQAWVQVTNVSGVAATEFTVLLDLGETTLQNGYEAEYEAVEGGYLATAPSWLQWNPIEQGESYRFAFIGSGTYEGVTPYIISIQEEICDTAPPTVDLIPSRKTFTADGTLTLTAEATDNVAIWKVVFEYDGEVIGEDWDAPYTVDVAITDALNGLQRYKATAVDPTGNEGSDEARVVVAIGNRFFGTAPGSDLTYGSILGNFDQITPENAGKWESVENTRDEMSWTDLDTAYNFAKDNGFPFKYHTLVWGKQQPGWLASLPQEEQLEELLEFWDALAARYPDIDMIDVVNEPLHSNPSYKEALGGDGETGWDWVINAFEIAQSKFPNAILLVNDYNILILEQLTASYLPVIDVLEERDLLDGIGVQGHFLEQADPAVVAANLDTLAATGLGIYVSEFDINYENDARQANVFKNLVTAFYDNPSMLGVTAWGHLQGAIWRQQAYLIRSDGSSRPALDWLHCFLAGGTDCPVPEYVPEPREGDDSGITLEVETYDEAEGLVGIEGSVAYTSDGSWFNLKRVVFNANWDILSVTYAKGNEDAASISLHLDSLENPALATVDLAPTGSWGGNVTIELPFAPVSGEHDLLVQFHGQNGVASLEKMKLTAPAGYETNIIANGDFESGTGGWYSWGADLQATDTVAYTGSRSLVATSDTTLGPAATNIAPFVEAGKTYTATVYTTIAGAASSNVLVQVALDCGSGASYPTLASGTVTPGTWTALSGDIAIPEECGLNQVQLQIQGYDIVGAEGTLSLVIDHVSVRAPVVDERVNIVANGTFEDGTSEGWSTWHDGTIGVTDQLAHSGTYSLIVTDRAANAPAATDLTAFVQPGMELEASFWVSIIGATNANVNVTTEINCDGSLSYPWLAQVNVAEGAWAEIAGPIQMPDCETVGLRVWAEGDTGVDILVDDVVILAPPAEPPENLLPNGDFETGADGWYTWGNTIVDVTDTIAATGEKSLVAASTNDLGPAATNIASLVEAGNVYKIDLQATIGGATGANVFVQVALNCGSGTTYPTLTGGAATAGEWLALSGEIEIPTACDKSQVQLQIQGNEVVGAEETLYLYIDDVVLTRLPQQVAVLSSDFEDGQAGPWYTWGSASEVTAAQAHGGAYSFAVSGTSLGKAVVQMSTILVPGKTYHLSCWVAVDGVDSADLHVTNTAECEEGDPKFNWITNVATVTPGTWAELTGTYAVPSSCGLIDAQFYIEGPVTNPGETVTLYVDDVLITTTE